MTCEKKAEGTEAERLFFARQFLYYGIKHVFDLIYKIENAIRLFICDIGHINTDFRLCLQFIKRTAGYLQKTDIVLGRISPIPLGNIARN